MGQREYEDPSFHAFMLASLDKQVAQLEHWGERPAGLLILMSACEGHCFFCAQPVVTNPPASMITSVEIIREKLYQNRNVGLQRLMIGGTEPTSHPEFEETLRLAQAYGFSEIELMTSGLSFRKNGRRWASMGVRSICSPLYSADPTVHDEIVGVSGHWRRVVAGIDTAFALGLEVHVHTLAMVRTLDHLSELGQWVKARWGGTVLVAPMRPKEEVFSFQKDAASLHEIAKIGDASLQWTGFPECVQSSGTGALLTRLYFRGQKTERISACVGCALENRCQGVVSGYLSEFGEAVVTTELCPHP